jgi:hypothetical protein
VQKGDGQCVWGTTYDLERLAGIFNAPNNAREAPLLADPPPHGPTSRRAVRAARIYPGVGWSYALLVARMGGSTRYPWPTASRPCLCVGAARGLLVVVRKADTHSPAPDTASSCNTHNIAHLALIHQCQVVAGKPSDTLQRLTNLDRVHWHQRTSWPRARESARMPPAESTPCAPAQRRAGHRPRRSPCQPCRVCPTPGCLRLNRLGSGSYHLSSLVWMSSRASLSHVLLCSRSAVALSPRRDPVSCGVLRSDQTTHGLGCGAGAVLTPGLSTVD